MKLPHKNFWKMLIDAIAFFDKNPTEWLEILVLKDNVEKLKAIEAEIALADSNQKKKDPSGYTTKKDTQLEVMLKLAYKLTCKIASYAINAGDQVLLSLVNFSSSQLEEGTEPEITARCQIIADKATEYLPKLTGFKVTADGIKKLTDAIDLYKKMPADRDLIKNERKTAVRSLNVLIPEARTLLKTIDINVDGLIDDETFIAEFHQIRAIFSRKLPSKKAKIVKETPIK
jgi:hypothetical protein